MQLKNTQDIVSMLSIIISIASILICIRIYIEQLKSEIKVAYTSIIDNELLNKDKARSIYCKLIKDTNTEYYNELLIKIINLLNDIEVIMEKQQKIIRLSHPVFNYLLCKTYNIDRLLIKSAIEYCSSHTGRKYISGTYYNTDIDKNFIVNIFYHLFGYSGYSGYIPYISTLTLIIERNNSIIDDRYKRNLYQFLYDYIIHYSYMLSMTKGLSIDNFDKYTVYKIEQHILKDTDKHNKATAFEFYLLNKNKEHIKKKSQWMHTKVFLCYLSIKETMHAFKWDVIKKIDDVKH